MMVGTIDFLVGGVRSNPVKVGKELRSGIFYVTGVAGDVVESATEPLRTAYRMAEVTAKVVRRYVNPMNQVD
jgi:hypothetical protein